MKPPENFTRIINRTRYNVATAALIASDAYWDGHNFERSGRNSFLYRTPKGNFFFVYLTCWQGERDTLEPATQDEAIEAYEGNLSEHDVSYTVAFPNVTIADA